MSKTYLPLHIYQDSQGVWWADVEKINGVPPHFPEVPSRSETLDGFPAEIREKVAKLKMCRISTDLEDGVLKGIGRRVGKREFWVYLEDRGAKRWLM